MKPADIEILAVISNPCDYASRYRLYREFELQLNNQRGVNYRLWTVELQHGQRDPQVTLSNNERHLQLWTSALPGEIWHKENLLNIGKNYITAHVPEWSRICWTDADFLWEPDAFAKIIRALDHYDIVQCWSHLINLAPDGSVINNQVGISYMWGLLNGELTRRLVTGNPYPSWLGSPGGAWAARRDSLNKIGTSLGSPLIDWAILGSGDLYFAASINGLLGDYFGLEGARVRYYTAGYRDSMLRYQETAVRELKKNIGVVPNTARHLFHGRAKDRQYNTRSDILVKYQFDPYTDIKKDVSGVMQLVVHNDRQIGLRDACRKYFFTRNEDATTL